LLSTRLAAGGPVRVLGGFAFDIASTSKLSCCLDTIGRSRLRVNVPRKKNPNKPARKFSDIFSKYKTYDPEEEGFGSPEEWKGAFRERMGLSEARECLRDKSPRGVLGVGASATWAEITKAFRKRVLEVHPDRIAVTGLTPEEAHRLSKEVVAAYSILAEEFGK